MTTRQIYTSIRAQDTNLTDVPQHAVFIDCDFTALDVTNLFLSDCTFYNCDFTAAVVRHSLFENAVFIDCSFSHAIAQHTSFKGAQFVGATDLDFYDITGSTFTDANLGPNHTIVQVTASDGTLVTAILSATYMTANSYAGHIEHFWHPALLDASCPHRFVNEPLRAALHRLFTLAKAA